MGRRRKKRNVAEETDVDAKTGAEEREKGLWDRLSLALTLVAVSIFAVFSGYLLGQYAIGWFSSPLVDTPRMEESGIQFKSGDEEAAPQESAATTAPSETASSSRPARQATDNADEAAPTILKVQVGHFDTRDEAAAVVERLKKADPPVPDAWVVRSDDGGEFRVQAGAFSGSEHADSFVAQLKAQGFDAYVAR